MSNIDLSINTISESDFDLLTSIFEISEFDIRNFSKSTPDKTYSGNYIRVIDFRYWNDIEMNNIIKLVDNFNLLSKNCEMIIDSYSDFLIEDDRYYEASFSFTFKPKI